MKSSLFSVFITVSLFISFSSALICSPQSRPQISHRHNHLQLYNSLNQISTKFPNYTKLFKIGSSHQGKDLYVLKISSNPSMLIPNNPQFLYIANMHGNEVVGREVLIAFAEDLLTQYSSGTDPSVSDLINSTQIYLLPSMNPDGRESSVEGDCTSTIGRFTATGVDLNRNFPDQYLSRDPSPRAVETTHVINFFSKNKFIVSANFHGGALVANYPFDSSPSGASTYSTSQDDDVFIHLAKAYASQNSALLTGSDNVGGATCAKFTNGITNGAEWFNVFGGMQDWAYLNAQSFHILVEMSCCKFPSDSSGQALSTLYDQNCPAIFQYLTEVHTGLKGFVVDGSQSDSLIQNATVTVQGREGMNSTTGQFGQYHRMLRPGVYSLSVSAPNMETFTTSITIPNSDTSSVPFLQRPFRKDFRLLPVGSTYSSADHNFVLSRTIDAVADHNLEGGDIDMPSQANGLMWVGRLGLPTSILYGMLVSLLLC